MKRTTKELQAILEKHMPGFQLVQDVPEDAVQEVHADEGTPDLMKMKEEPVLANYVDANWEGTREATPYEVEGGGGPVKGDEPEDQLVQIVPKGVADSSEAARHTKTVLISADGKILAQQG